MDNRSQEPALLVQCRYSVRTRPLAIILALCIGCSQVAPPAWAIGDFTDAVGDLQNIRVSSNGVLRYALDGGDNFVYAAGSVVESEPDRLRFEYRERHRYRNLEILRLPTSDMILRDLDYSAD